MYVAGKIKISSVIIHLKQTKTKPKQTPQTLSVRRLVTEVRAASSMSLHPS